MPATFQRTHDERLLAGIDQPRVSRLAPVLEKLSIVATYARTAAS